LLRRLFPEFRHGALRLWRNRAIRVLDADRSKLGGVWRVYKTLAAEGNHRAAPGLLHWRKKAKLLLLQQFEARWRIEPERPQAASCVAAPPLAEGKKAIERMRFVEVHTGAVGEV